MSGARAVARVVSLLPSATETLLAWRVEPVACTRFCEQPNLPHVGGTKDPDVAAIVALRPDLVVMDEEENRREDADALTAAGLDVLVTAVRSVGDVGPTLARLASALDVGEVTAISATTPEAGAPPPPGPTAFVPIWRRPWMTINAGTYGSSLLDAVGVGNVFGDHPDRYPTLDSLAAAAALAPTRVLAPSEPYPFSERHRDELEAVAPATFIDGRDLFWWGVRTPDALRRLREVL